MVSGVTSVETDWDEEQEGPVVLEALRPEYFNPAPRLIPIPQGTPDPVAENLRTACSVMWHDPAAAGNRIRASVERLMDSFGIATRTLNRKQRKYQPLSLHARIDRFAKTQPILGGQLLAVKWLGNTGSHSALTRADVYDALDIVSHVLDELYVRRGKQIASLAKAINKRKGPRKAAR